MFGSLGQYDKAEECLQKALIITAEIGDKKGEAICYGNQGVLLQSLGQNEKAKEYLHKALVIRTEIGDREGEAADYGNLGTVFDSLGQYGKERLKNISKKRLSSKLKLATGKVKQLPTET